MNNKTDDENKEIFIALIKEACKGINIREVSCEQWYQKLLEKSDKTENDQFLFKVMNDSRVLFNTIEESYKERNSNLDEIYNNLDEIYNNLDSKNSFLEFFDWDSRPINMWEYYFKRTYFSVHVGDDSINKWRISTIWLGLNHSFFSDHLPLIFETKIFNEENCHPDIPEFIDYQERYSTLEEAEEGHKRACEFVKRYKKIDN